MAVGQVAVGSDDRLYVFWILVSSTIILFCLKPIVRTPSLEGHHTTLAKRVHP